MALYASSVRETEERSINADLQAVKTGYMSRVPEPTEDVKLSMARIAMVKYNTTLGHYRVQSTPMSSLLPIVLPWNNL